MSLNSTDRKRTRRRFDPPARVQSPEREDLKLLKKKFPDQYNRRFREKIGFRGPLVPFPLAAATRHRARPATTFLDVVDAAITREVDHSRPRFAATVGNADPVSLARLRIERVWCGYGNRDREIFAEAVCPSHMARYQSASRAASFFFVRMRRRLVIARRTRLWFCEQIHASGRGGGANFLND